MGQGKFVDIHGKRRKRIGIFFFYDADGVADNYIEYLLNGIVDCLDNLVIVSNGELTREAKALFGKFTQRGARNTGKLIIRENTGFDVWAYKAAIDYLGWEELGCCGELILFNHTIMGPVYPFEEVFDKMDSIETDYWGLNVHYGISSDLMGSPYRYIPKHLQSHFLAFRNNVIRSKLFHNYWEKLPQIKS